VIALDLLAEAAHTRRYAPAAVGLTGGDLAFQAGSEELLMCPILRPGAFSETLVGLGHRWRFQRPTQVGEIGCRPVRRLGDHQLTSPMRS
jgi:hypothetical protein